MDLILHPRKLQGAIQAIPSKSQAHRLLICAAFADGPTRLICPQTSRDIQATAECLCSLGAAIEYTGFEYRITPILEIPKSATLNCCESGSTLRFLLPIVGALGIEATFLMEGRLPERPLSPLWEEMERMGCHLSRPEKNQILCTGKLQSGDYTIDGSVSSQYITGLLFALSLLTGETSLTITGKTESLPYIEMTKAVMALFQAPQYHTPGTVTVEGDWSNGAFFLAAQYLNNPVTVMGLEPSSFQGDRAALHLLELLNKQYTQIDAADIPDLVPILSVVAAACHGARFTNIRRLRIKESDRVKAIIDMIRALGGQAEADENTLTIYGADILGGTVDSVNDHRIAMSAAIASTVAKNPITILGADAVKKSYPTFWEEFQRLGGYYEQYIR